MLPNISPHFLSVGPVFPPQAAPSRAHAVPLPRKNAACRMGILWEADKKKHLRYVFATQVFRGLKRTP